MRGLKTTAIGCALTKTVPSPISEGLPHIPYFLLMTLHAEWSTEARVRTFNNIGITLTPQPQHIFKRGLLGFINLALWKPL